MDAALDAVRTSLEADARSFAGQVRATARLLDAARAGGGADRAFVELEAAGSWSVGQATASRLLVEAEHLTTCLPATLAALETGALLVHQARVLLHVTRNADPAIARQVEAEVLAADDLAGLCPSDLRALATRVLLRLESEAVDAALADARHEQAAAAAPHLGAGRHRRHGRGRCRADRRAARRVEGRARRARGAGPAQRPRAGRRPDGRPAAGRPVRRAAGARARGPRAGPGRTGGRQQRAGASAGGAQRARADGDRARAVRRAGAPRRVRPRQRRARPPPAPGRLPAGPRRRRHRPAGAPRRPPGARPGRS